MLKTKKLLELADHLEACQDLMTMRGTDYLTYSSNKFGMYHVFLPGCGSPACVTGHGLALHGYTWSDCNSIHSFPLNDFAILYGLEDGQKNALCTPSLPNALWFEMNPARPGYISARHAAFTIRHLAKAGVVDYATGLQLMIEDDQKKADSQTDSQTDSN